MAKIKKSSFHTVYLPLDEYGQEENDEEDGEKKLSSEMIYEKTLVPTHSANSESCIIKTEEINEHPTLSKFNF
jgi:hypothetical protein